MTKYSKFNIIYRLQKWLDSVPGQTFMNYAYSWGASIVILGTLFKLTHLPGANLMLFIGMGTEVFVFFIAAFDRPFDKTADGMELPTHVGGMELAGANGTDHPQVSGDGTTESPAGIETSEGFVQGGSYGGGGYVGGGGFAGGGGGFAGGSSGGGTIIIGGGGAATTGEDGQVIAEGGELPTGTAASAGPVITGAINIPEQPELPEIDGEAMEEATTNYVDALKNLTEMLNKVSEQSERLTRDSEEMENLNRTLTGICKVYEMQLKGASQQIGTIDQINDQTRKMAEQIAELNRIYARMIEAMTTNMPKLNNNGN